MNLRFKIWAMLTMAGGVAILVTLFSSLPILFELNNTSAQLRKQTLDTMHYYQDNWPTGGTMMSLDTMRYLYRNMHFDNNAYAYVISEATGDFLVHPTLQGKTSKDIITDDGRSIYQVMLDQKEGSVHYFFNGAEKTSYFFQDAAGTAFFAIAYTDKELHGVGEKLFLTVIFGLVFLSLFLIVVYIFIFISLFNPLVNLGKKIKEISNLNGDLGFRFPLKKKKKLDEIESIKNDFNLMLSSLSSLIGEINSRSLSINYSNFELANGASKSDLAAKNTASGVSKILLEVDSLLGVVGTAKSAEDQLGKAFTTLSNEIVNQVAAIEQTSAIVEEITASFTSVSNVARARTTEVKKVQTTVDKSLAAVDAVKQVVDQTVIAVTRISEVADNIKNISEQTTILAINAAIESAHAGNFGRGFSVIAQEVRKLSETSAAQSGEAERLVKNIKLISAESVESLASLISLMGDLHKETQDSIQSYIEISSHMDELAIGGNEILKATTELNRVSQEVHQSSKMLEGIRESFGEIIASVDHSANQSKVVVSEILDMSKKTSAISTEVKTNVEKISKTTAELVEHVSKFKT
jgi:methyl-accepting chemotaxis protein